MAGNFTRLGRCAAALLALLFAGPLRAQDLSAVEDTIRQRIRGQSDERSQDPGIETVDVGAPSAKLGGTASSALSQIANVGTAGTELNQIVAMMLHPAEAAQMGLRAPRSILLTGPSASAKNHLVTAFLHDANWTYQRVKGDDLVAVGTVPQGQDKVDKAFAQARSQPRSVLVIESIEKIAEQGSGSRPLLAQLQQLANDPTGTGRAPPMILVGVVENDAQLDPNIVSLFERTIQVDNGEPGSPPAR